MAKFLKWFNFVWTFVWVILVFPSLIWWKNSILWVILISLWANIVGHFSAYIAARAELSSSLTEKDKEWLVECLKK